MNSCLGSGVLLLHVAYFVVSMLGMFCHSTIEAYSGNGQRCQVSQKLVRDVSGNSAFLVEL